MQIFPDFLKIGIEPFSCEPEGENSLLFLRVTKVKKFFRPINSEIVLSQVASGFSICSTCVKGRTMPISVALSSPDSSRTCWIDRVIKKLEFTYFKKKPLEKSVGCSSAALESEKYNLEAVRSYSKGRVDQNTWKLMTTRISF